jgi:hypothetical protein
VPVTTIPVKINKARSNKLPRNKRAAQPQPGRQPRLFRFPDIGFTGRVGCSLIIKPSIRVFFKLGSL